MTDRAPYGDSSEQPSTSSARRCDEADRWDPDGGFSSARSRRSSPQSDLSLFADDFTDFERMSRDRHDD